MRSPMSFNPCRFNPTTLFSLGFLVGSAVLGASAAIAAPMTTPATPTKIVDARSSLPLKTGMSYETARRVILKAGWQPNLTGEKNLGDRRVKALYDAGYPEVEDCSGTGLAPCLFTFTNARGEMLSVSTNTSRENNGRENNVLRNWWAKQQSDRKLLFSCNTQNGKRILLQDAGQTIDYTFGKLNQTPELSLKVPRNQASTWQWQGIGRWMNYSIEVPNQETLYSVFWSMDRLNPKNPVDAGVQVRVNSKVVATVQCSSNIVNQMQGVDLRPISP
jgi:hypothetical protein